jgi:hypothetical protein
MDFQLLNKTVCLCGKRHSGKSELIKYIVSLYGHQFNKIFVICPSEAVNKFYSQFLPSENIFTEYKEEWIEKLMARLIKINVGEKNNEAAHILLILDDCVSDHNFHQSPTIKKLFLRGRHISISLLITTQYIYLISPSMRNNLDYLLCGQMNKQSIDLVTTEFLSGDIEKSDFVKMYSRCTKDYNFLVINNNSVKDDDLNSIYGCVKAPFK